MSIITRTGNRQLNIIIIIITEVPG